MTKTSVSVRLDAGLRVALLAVAEVRRDREHHPAADRWPTRRLVPALDDLPAPIAKAVGASRAVVLVERLLAVVDLAEVVGPRSVWPFSTVGAVALDQRSALRSSSVGSGDAVEVEPGRRRRPSRRSAGIHAGRRRSVALGGSSSDARRPGRR